MIASLPMYDLPDCRAANDRFWAAIRDAWRQTGRAAPETLTRDVPDLVAHWQRRDLVLSQTCGFPYRTLLQGKVTLIGTPDYGLEGCPPGYYQSLFVVRADDSREGLSAFKDARFAYNEALSQSGWAAAQSHVAPLGFAFRSAGPTKAHALSAKAVLEGRADIAALDAVTWRLLQRNDATMAGLRVVARTAPTPGLAFIAGPVVPHKPMFDAVAQAIATLDATDRAILGIKRLLFIPAPTYLAVPTPAPPDQIVHQV